MYANIDLDIPRNMKELVARYSRAKDNPLLLAGGTVALVELRSGKIAPKAVVSLDRIAGLRGIRKGAKSLTIGARTTVTDLLESTDAAKLAPSLVQAAGIFAGLMVRNAATIGGNIACGSPAADLVPPLLALDAQLMLEGRGKRKVALADYYRGYKSDVRKKGELISKIVLPDLNANDFCAFYKLARRKGDAITVTGVAVTIRFKGRHCEKVRIALGAVSPAPMRAVAAEAVLRGKALTAELIEEAASAAAAECAPISDVRASAAYRKKMVRVLVQRLLTQAAERTI